MYLALLADGLAVDHDHDANFVPLNDADNWLHAGLGIVMLALGTLLPGDRVAVTSRRVSAGSAYDRDRR